MNVPSMNDPSIRFPHDEATPPADNAELEALWDRLGDVPAPRAERDLRPRFDSMLEAYRQGIEDGRARSGQTLRGWSPQSLVAAAAAFALLAIGLVAGRQLAMPEAAPTGEVAALRKEIGELSRVVTTTLLERGSAAERLHAVEVARRGQARDVTVAAALLEAVRHDGSANVRLAALEALAPLVSEHSALRTALAEALTEPAPPLVGVALIDTLLAAGAAGQAALRTVPADALDASVRQHLDERLGSLL